MRNPTLEDFSVLCEICNKWFHYICLRLKGDKDKLKEENDIPYYCPTCKSLRASDCSGGASQQSSIENVTEMETPVTSKRKHPIKKSSKACENQPNSSPSAC